MSPGGKGTKTYLFWGQVIKFALEIHYEGKYKTQVVVGSQLFGGPYRADFLMAPAEGGGVLSFTLFWI